MSVLARTFRSITDEMSASVVKTTRSPILCEAKDFVTGLYDAHGNMLEQTENLPILAFSLGPVCKHLVRYFGDDIHDGDVIFHNDVFSFGNQNNDVAVYKPIFHDGALVAWAAVKGHQADIGGAVPGGYNPNAKEVWQEALRIPPVKVYEKGKLRRDVWDLIFANIRFDIVQHDLKAQMGACTIGERRMRALLQKYGRDVFETHKTALFDATEKMMQAEIARIPNGVYSGEGMVYFDGHHQGSKFTIRVTITVEDAHVKFDYSKTDAQTDGFVNGTYTSSASATLLTFLQFINPDIPHNEGMIRPIDIVIPEGTILNARYPKATTFGNHLCPPNADAIIRALAPVIPDRVTAGWNNLLCSLTTGLDPETQREIRRHRLHGIERRLRRHAGHRRLRSHRHDRRVRRRARPGLRDVRAADAAPAHPTRIYLRFRRRRTMARRARRRDQIQDRLGRDAAGDLRRRRFRAGVRPVRRP